MRDFDEFIKTAATYKELMKAHKTQAPHSKVKLLDYLAGPNQFVGKTKTKSRPRLDDDKNIYYHILTHGRGSKSDTIDAEADLIDIVDKYHKEKGDDDYNAYNKRMKPYIDKYKQANFITRGHHGRKMLKNMTDDEREELVKRRDSLGDLHTKDPRNAQRVISRTTYYY